MQTSRTRCSGLPEHTSPDCDLTTPQGRNASRTSMAHPMLLTMARCPRSRLNAPRPKLPARVNGRRPTRICAPLRLSHAGHPPPRERIRQGLEARGCQEILRIDPASLACPSMPWRVASPAFLSQTQGCQFTRGCVGWTEMRRRRGTSDHRQCERSLTHRKLSMTGRISLG